MGTIMVPPALLAVAIRPATTILLPPIMVLTAPMQPTSWILVLILTEMVEQLTVLRAQPLVVSPKAILGKVTLVILVMEGNPLVALRASLEVTDLALVMVAVVSNLAITEVVNKVITLEVVNNRTTENLVLVLPMLENNAVMVAVAKSTVDDTSIVIRRI